MVNEEVSALRDGIPSAVLSGVAAYLKAEPESYSGWNPHDEQYDDGWNAAVRWIVQTLEDAIKGNDDISDGDRLREHISDALAVGARHLSDCAVFAAPAQMPGSCNCPAQAGEARRTATTGAVHEHAVAEPCAQPQGEPS